MSNYMLHFVTPPILYFIDNGKHTYLPGERHISRHHINAFDLIIVTKGTLFIGENGHQWAVHRGEALILRPDAYHYGTAPCEEKTELKWIHFQTFGAWNEVTCSDEFYEQEEALFQQHKQLASIHHCEMSSLLIPKKFALCSKAITDLDEFFSLDEEPLSFRNWRKQTLFQNFIHHLNQAPKKEVSSTTLQLAKKIERFIRNNYMLKINNTVLKNEFNYHPNYLAKCMLAVYGVTPIHYLQQYRIEQAKKLLIQTDWSITRIANEVGFSTPAYFSSVFNEKVGVSPANFRKQHIDAEPLDEP